MTPRVECDLCQHFSPVKFADEQNWLSKIICKAKCDLGKRVMFRSPDASNSYFGGYFRYCNEFKLLKQ